MFEDDKFGIAACEEKYCEVCCEKRIDWMHNVIRANCHK
jgi:hypothetical protein